MTVYDSLPLIGEACGYLGIAGTSWHRLVYQVSQRCFLVTFLWSHIQSLLV